MNTDVVFVGAGPADMSVVPGLNGFDGRVLVLEQLSDTAFGGYHSICSEAVSDRMFSRLGFGPTAVMARMDRIEIEYPEGATVAVLFRGNVLTGRRCLGGLGPAATRSSSGPRSCQSAGRPTGSLCTLSPMR